MTDADLKSVLRLILQAKPQKRAGLSWLGAVMVRLGLPKHEVMRGLNIPRQTLDSAIETFRTQEISSKVDAENLRENGLISQKARPSLPKISANASSG